MDLRTDGVGTPGHWGECDVLQLTSGRLFGVFEQNVSIARLDEDGDVAADGMTMREVLTEGFGSDIDVGETWAALAWGNGGLLLVRQAELVEGEGTFSGETHQLGLPVGCRPAEMVDPGTCDRVTSVALIGESRAVVMISVTDPPVGEQRAFISLIDISDPEAMSQLDLVPLSDPGVGQSGTDVIVSGSRVFAAAVLGRERGIVDVFDLEGCP
jgi:hypothetical protein